MIELITKLEKSGDLKKLINAGFISTKLLLYYEIYLEVDKQLRTTTKPKYIIVEDVGSIFRVSSQTVWRAIKLIKNENSSSLPDKK